MYISALRGRFVERQDTCCHYDDVWKFVTPGRQPHIHSTSSAHLFAREGRKEGRQQTIFSAMLVGQWKLNFTFLAVEVISEKYRILILVDYTKGFEKFISPSFVEINFTRKWTLQNWVNFRQIPARHIATTYPNK